MTGSTGADGAVSYAAACGSCPAGIVPAGVDALAHHTHLVPGAVVVGGAARGGDGHTRLKGVTHQAGATHTGDCCQFLPQQSRTGGLLPTGSLLTEVLAGVVETCFSPLAVPVSPAGWRHGGDALTRDGCVPLGAGTLYLVVLSGANLAAAARVVLLALVNTEAVDTGLSGRAGGVVTAAYGNAGHVSISRKSSFTDTFCGVLSSLTLGVCSTRVCHRAGVNTLVVQTHTLGGTFLIRHTSCR